MSSGFQPEVHYFSGGEPHAYSTHNKIFISWTLSRKLTPAQLRAVICHETGHIVRRHWTWKAAVDLLALASIALIALYIEVSDPTRIGLIWAMVPTWYYLRRFVNHQTEYDADAFASRNGYGQELSEALVIATNRYRTHTFEHPSVRSRIARMYEKG